MLRLSILSILTIPLCLWTHASAQDAKAVKDEIDRFQGVWKPITAENEGNELDPKEDEWTIKFTGDKVVQLRKGELHVEGTIQIERNKNNLKRTSWKYINVDVTDSVIYFFIGTDTLVTCWTGKEGGVPEWPTRFATNTPGGGRYLVVWKREK